VLARRIFPAVLGGAGAVGALCAWEMGAPDLLSQPSFGMSVYRALNSPQMLAPGESAARAWLAALGVPIIALYFCCPPRALYGVWRRKIRVIRRQTRRDCPGRALARWFCSFRRVLFCGNCFPRSKTRARLRPPSRELGRDFQHARHRDIFGHFPPFSSSVFAFAVERLALEMAAFRAGRHAFAGTFCAIVIGVALIEAWNRAALGAVYDSSLGMVLVGHFARFFPLAVALFWVPLSNLDPDWKRSAQNLGASPLRAFWTTEIRL
jgi:ABC-type Fe3+ transport system permease subunit